MEIIKLAMQDKEKLKETMLYALEKDPKAFSVDFDEYNTKTYFWWETYLNIFFTPEKGGMFSIQDTENNIQGICGYLLEQKNRSKHVSSLVWMYIKEDFRGKGLSKKLFEAVENTLKTKGIKKIKLSVGNKQNAAINLYQNLGFTIVGEFSNELLVNNEMINVVLMEKFL